MRDIFVTSVLSLCLTPILFLGIFLAQAQSVQSTNYTIISSSVNFGGGYSTSSTQTLESTGGEIATGLASSTNFNLKAGYQQMQEIFISMTAPSPVALDPAIPGITGGVSNGSTTVTVVTDSASGYTLTIASSLSPSMQNGAQTIADYVPVGDPDFSFSINLTDAHLGFSPSGSNIVTRYKDNGAVCNSAGGDTLLACWDGLSTTARTIATSATGNQPNGASTTIYFRVGVGGGSVGLTPGTYTATTTLTALPQ